MIGSTHPRATTRHSPVWWRFLWSSHRVDATSAALARESEASGPREPAAYPTRKAVTGAAAWVIVSADFRARSSSTSWSMGKWGIWSA